MCLRAKPIGVGNLLNGFLGEGQLLLNLVRKVFVDDGLGCLSRYTTRYLSQISCANVQLVGIKLHVAVGAMVLCYLVGELVKQFSTPADDARVVGLQLGNVVACVYHCFEDGIATVYESGDGGRQATTKSVASVAFALSEQRGEKGGLTVFCRGEHVGKTLRGRVTAL